MENSPRPDGRVARWPAIREIDPGWLYVIRNCDLYKIGKTTNPERRLLKEAKTWLPDCEILGVKPFFYIHQFERTLLCGLAQFWYSGEWHQFPDESFSSSLISDFSIFSDHDRHHNTYEFSYWIRGSGMAEIIMEQNRRRVSLRKFQRDPY